MAETTHRFRFCPILMFLILACCSPLAAVQPGNGFFTGVDLEPLANASIAAVESEPAVCLIFATDQKTADITRQFDEWYSSPSRPDVSVFAIAVGPVDLSRDIVIEAINQRGLKMPVYLARADMLLGDDYRLLVLNDDQEVQRFTTLDFAGVNTALSGLGITLPAGASTAPVSVTPAVPPPSPTATPGVTVESESSTLPDGSSYSTVTTTTTTRTESQIFGGPGGEAVYRNEAYGFQVEFPPDWKYQVPAKSDGAVAIPPPGSRMDMRAWSVPQGDIDNPQEYIDDSLDALARKYRTRVNVDRRFNVRADGQDGLDVSYVYTRPINADMPAAGGLLYRGRMQVFISNGSVLAASVEAPTGEFMAATPTIESFFRTFKVLPGDNQPSAGYNSPIL